jgi:hypothetical protein
MQMGGGAGAVAIPRVRTKSRFMRRVVIVLVACVVIPLTLSACAEWRTKVYLWPPASDVNDP